MRRRVPQLPLGLEAAPRGPIERRARKALAPEIILDPPHRVDGASSFSCECEAQVSSPIGHRIRGSEAVDERDEPVGPQHDTRQLGPTESARKRLPVEAVRSSAEHGQPRELRREPIVGRIESPEGRFDAEDAPRVGGGTVG